MWAETALGLLASSPLESRLSKQWSAETSNWGEGDALYLRPQIRGKGGKESRKEVTCLWTGYVIIHSLFHPARAFSIDKEGSWACGKECQDLSGGRVGWGVRVQPSIVGSGSSGRNNRI